MNTILDSIFLRRPKLEYVCPPICEVLFSSTGAPVIVLNPLPRLTGPTGLVAGGPGHFTLSWNRYPGALCYTIYKAVNPLDPFGPYMIIAECIDGSTPGCPDCPPQIDLTIYGDGCYRVSAITEGGESELSDPNCDVGHGSTPGETPTLVVQATTPDAFENGQIPGVFTIYRQGDASNPITVNYVMSGTATNGTHYLTLSGSINMPAGAASITVMVVPVDLSLSDLSLTAILTLSPSGQYNVGTPGAATITIHEDDTVSAPESIFVADGSLMGQLTLGNSINSKIQWFGLDIGSYIFVYVDRMFQLFEDTCPLGCEASWGINNVPPNWVTTGGDSGTLPNQTGTIVCCGGGGQIGYASEALAITDYKARSMPSFTNLSATNSTIDAEINIDGINVFVPTGPDMVFDLMRTQKLIAPEPISLQIQNLASYSTSRFIINYNSEGSSFLAFDATSGDVQTALNNMTQITSDGGVVCAGNLTAGLSVTWNVNGSRSLLDPNVVTVSPGWTCTIARTQAGNGSQPEIQSITVVPICSEFVFDNSLPEYDGSLPVRTLNIAEWAAVSSYNPNAPVARQNNIQFLQAISKLHAGADQPATAPTVANGGAGSVNAGTHTWKISFTNANGEGPVGPASDPLVLGSPSQVNLTNIPTGPAGTTARNIYRTRVDNISTAYYLVATINDNTTTIFTDNVDDTSIFQIPPPASKFWDLRIICVFFDSGFNFDIECWTGFKITGNTPAGTYQRYPLYLENFSPCGSGDRGIQQITLIGNF